MRPLEELRSCTVKVGVSTWCGRPAVRWCWASASEVAACGWLGGLEDPSPEVRSFCAAHVSVLPRRAGHEVDWDGAVAFVVLSS